MDGPPLAVQHKWSKGTSYGLEVSFQGDWLFFCNSDIWQSWHSLSANVLSRQCLQQYLSKVAVLTKYLSTLLAIILAILYHLPWWSHQPSPIFLMHSYHLPDKAHYCSMFIDLEAWHILHQRKRLLSAQGPTSRSLDRSHLLLFSFFTNIILPSGYYNQGSPQKNLQTKVEICPNRTWVQ